ncbi:hypothetical protein AgCh_025130 [Apium graveolens]
MLKRPGFMVETAGLGIVECSSPNPNLSRVQDNLFCGDSFKSGSDVGIDVVTDLSSTESESSSRNYTTSPGAFAKITEKIDDAGTVLLKHYVCSCEGFNNPKDDPKVLKRRSFTRSKSLSFSKEMYGGYANEKSKAFYCAYDVDSDGRLTKLFWVDSIGRRNFELYGDTISFHATFDTNRYNLIFAPFTGVDKHDRCVTFASCLLSHESVADYIWEFVHLVKAMGQNPVLIITDHCPAMKVSVCDVFYDVNGLDRSKHRLCMWHIMEKFPVKFHKQGDTLCEFWFRFESAMDKQRNETVRLDHETKSSLSTTLSKWFIEDDAITLYTRTIFYKIQEEILASCLEMQIKHTSKEVDGVTHFEIRDVRVKEKPFKFDFRQTVDKAVVEMDRFEHVHNTIKKLNTKLDDYDGSIVSFTKKDHIAAMVGKQHEGEVNILPPNVCKNKGNYFKRLMSDREKAINKSKKRIRKCALCGATTHNARRCIKRKKTKVE